MKFGEGFLRVLPFAVVFWLTFCVVLFVGLQVMKP
jgi:hypothetical protein